MLRNKHLRLDQEKIAKARRTLKAKTETETLDMALDRSLGIELRSLDDLAEPAFRLALRYHLSPCDCAYPALADKEGCDFYTGDRKLFQATGPRFPWVKWIGDCSQNRTFRS